METNEFDKIIASKLNAPESDGVRSHWGKMSRLLLFATIKRRFSWFYLLIPLLLLSLLFNGIVGWNHLSKSVPSASAPPIVRKSMVVYDTIIKKDTLYITDTVLVIKKVYRKQRLAQNGYPLAPTVAEKRKPELDTAKNIRKTGLLSSADLPMQKTAEAVSLSHSVKKANDLYDSLKQASARHRPVYPYVLPSKSDLKNDSASAQNKRASHQIPSAIASNASSNKDSSSVDENVKRPEHAGHAIPFRFQLGVAFNAGPLTVKNMNGWAISFGPLAHLSFSEHMGLYLSFRIQNSSYQIKKNPFAISSFYPPVSDTTSIHELYVNNQVMDIPMGATFTFPLTDWLRLYARTGIVYQYFLEQKFDYELTDYNHIIVSDHNGYSGFNQMELGMGVSYLWHKKLRFSLLPVYRFSFVKSGIEKINYSTLTGEVLILWQF